MGQISIRSRRASGSGTVSSASEDEIRHGIEGNLCRCTGYHNIVKAIEYAAAKMRNEAPAPAEWEVTA